MTRNLGLNRKPRLRLRLSLNPNRNLGLNLKPNLNLKLDRSLDLSIRRLQ